MDAEQVSREMSMTRASIDRKLDALTARTTVVSDAAKQQLRRRGPTVALNHGCSRDGLLVVAAFAAMTPHSFPPPDTYRGHAVAVSCRGETSTAIWFQCRE